MSLICTIEAISPGFALPYFRPATIQPSRPDHPA